MSKQRQYCCSFTWCDGSSSIYSSQKKQYQPAKPVVWRAKQLRSAVSRNRVASPEIMATVLQISQVTNPFSPCYLLLCFLLSDFFILCSIGLCLCFDVFCHRVNIYACLVRVYHYYWVYFHFKSLSYSLPFLSWHKTTAVFDKCRWLQRCRFVVIDTYCVYVKTQTFLEILYRLILHRYSKVWHPPELLLLG